MKYFTITLSVETSDEENLETFTDKIMAVIDSENWTCGGGFCETDEEGNPIRPSNG